MRTGMSRLGLGMWLALAIAVSAQAADFDLTAGASARAGVRWTPTLFFSIAGTPTDDGQAHFAPIASAGFIGSRSTTVHDLDLDHDVFLTGGGVRYWYAKGLFVSEQIMATGTRTDALSSRFEFMTSLGLAGSALCGDGAPHFQRARTWQRQESRRDHAARGGAVQCGWLRNRRKASRAKAGRAPDIPGRCSGKPARESERHQGNLAKSWIPDRRYAASGMTKK